MSASRALALLLFAWSWLAVAAHAQEPAALRRFAIIVGANDGGAARPALKHALADARAVSAVLRELGGVGEADALLLAQPSVEQLARAFEAVRASSTALAAQSVRSELVFYYSGHSDEAGLLLGGAALSYRTLRTLLDRSAAQVRVAILDSCASGAFTRDKGGVHRPPFLFDASAALRGHAFLTSASESEAAQESDRLGGSFFTHYLVSGLRGAADVSGDRQVTLTEAYRFAFEETLARTGQTQHGAQHPAYDIRLVGTGDLVLTDLRSTASQLELAPALSGRLLLRDLAGGVFLELNKPLGKPLRIALPASTYALELWRAGQLFRAQVTTRAAAAPYVVSPEQLLPVRLEPARSRGSPSYRLLPLAAALVAPYGSNRRAAGAPVQNQFDFALLYDDPDALLGLQLSPGCVRARDFARGLQLAGACASARALDGVQLAAVAQASGGSRGLQLAALDLALGSWQGAQLGAISWARQLSGAQLGGVNLVGQGSGLQLGLINVASGRLHGVQLGVINYADEADVAFGALSVTRQGGVHALMLASDVALLSWALRLGAKYNYSFVEVGYHPWGGERHAGYALGLGFGAKLPLWRALLWLDMDLGAHVLQRPASWRRGLPNTLYQLRGMLRWQLHPRVSLLAGPTFNVLLQLDAAERVRLGIGVKSHSPSAAGDAVRVAYWPGFAAGVGF